MWSYKTPFISNLFVHYQYRKKGIATNLVRKIETHALLNNFKKIFLKSGSAANFYKKLGYTDIDQQTSKNTLAGKETLFEKTLY